MKKKTVAGVILLILNVCILYYRRDIIIELINGRPVEEIKIYKLVLPLILLIITIYLFLNSKNNEKN